MEAARFDQVVSITATDAVIEGRLVLPAKAIGIVAFAHGSGSSRHSPRNNYVASVLHQAQIGTLLLDLLTPQEDEQYANRFDIALLTQRLLAALAWLKREKRSRSCRLGIFGASTGAAAALEAAAVLGDAISVVVSRGGRPDLASGHALHAVRAPTLLIVGALDQQVLQLNRQAYAQLQCEKSLHIIPGATHLFEEAGTLEQVAHSAADWLEKMFRHPPFPIEPRGDGA
ncbi:MAG: dienelactone hydrolase family protein [Oxalobacteraceae bacterium]